LQSVQVLRAALIITASFRQQKAESVLWAAVCLPEAVFCFLPAARINNHHHNLKHYFVNQLGAELGKPMQW
jgi:hypothetical protein